MKALILALTLVSQPWSLQQCIDWALENNLSVASQALTVEDRRLDKNTADNAWLPQVNASAGENFNFGRGIGGNNTYDYGNSSSTSFGLNANMTLFDGLATPRRAQLAKLNLDAALADLEKARNDIRMKVTQAYVQILYDYEIADVSQNQVDIDSLQVARLESLLASGKASAAEVSQQKASLAQSRVSLINARNDVRTSLLSLAQLLEIPFDESFCIVRPTLELEEVVIGHPDDIYADALGLRPEIQAEKLRLDGAAKQLQIARAAYLPSLSLSAGMGTNYYTSFASQGFMDQMKNNFSQYVGLTLSIPIFNRFSTRNSVRSAQLQQRSQQLQLRQTQQTLYKEIQQAWNKAVAAQAKWEASRAASDAAQDAFELMQAKYENGKATITEFNETRNQLVKAQSDAVQATYEYLFQTRLVEFYRGGALVL